MVVEAESVGASGTTPRSTGAGFVVVEPLRAGFVGELVASDALDMLGVTAEGTSEIGSASIWATEKDCCPIVELVVVGAVDSFAVVVVGVVDSFTGYWLVNP